VRLTPERALAACERDLKRLGRSPCTISNTLSVARGFVARFGAHTDVDDVRAFLADAGARLKASSQAAMLARLRCFFSTLVRLALLRADPSAGLTVERPRVRASQLLSEASVGALLSAAARPCTNAERDRARALRDRVAIELLYGLGLRASELRATLVSDVDLKRGQLFVRRAKGGRPEPLPVPPSAVAAVRRYLADGRPALARGHDEGRLVLQNDGRPLPKTGVNRLVSRVGRKAGLKVHPHALRRAVATHLVERAVPITAVQRLLGHERLETTQIYVEVDRAALRRAVETLERT
jgi:site-specific recombinase XerD